MKISRNILKHSFKNMRFKFQSARITPSEVEALRTKEAMSILMKLSLRQQLQGYSQGKCTLK